MGRGVATTTVLALLIVAAWSPAPGASAEYGLIVSAGGLSAQAKLRYYSQHGPAGPPSTALPTDLTPRVRLPVRPRQSVVLTFAATDPPARVVTVTLGRPKRVDRTQAVTLWAKRATAVSSDGHRWRVRLPRRLRDATFLGTSVGYPAVPPPGRSGAADFVTGVRWSCNPD